MRRARRGGGGGSGRCCVQAMRCRCRDVQRRIWWSFNLNYVRRARVWVGGALRLCDRVHVGAATARHARTSYHRTRARCTCTPSPGQRQVRMASVSVDEVLPFNPHDRERVLLRTRAILIHMHMHIIRKLTPALATTSMSRWCVPQSIGHQSLIFTGNKVYKCGNRAGRSH